MPPNAPHPLNLPVFERALLRGDASTLYNAGLRDAALLAAGHFDSFIPHRPIHPSLPASTLSIRIAHEAHVSAATDVTISSPTLSAALSRPSSLLASSPPDLSSLLAAYTAGVALLHAFLRDNWAGPSSSPLGAPTSPASPTQPEAVPVDAAALFLSVDGEDVARPAVALACLRAARLILVDAAPMFARAGAPLIHWWAARALLAHQAVLSHPAPTLQHSIFSMFGAFLGPEAAHTRDLFSAATNGVAGTSSFGTSLGIAGADESNDDDDDDDDFLPTPLAPGADDMRDDGDEFVCHLDSDSPDRHLLILAQLELSLAQKMFFDGDAAHKSLRKACRTAGIHYRVSGEMGVRTKHQQKETAQLVCRAFIVKHPVPSPLPDDSAGRLAYVFPTPSSHGANAHGSSSGNTDVSTDRRAAALPMPKNVQVDDTDVLGFVKLSEKGKECNDDSSNLFAEAAANRDSGDEEDSYQADLELGDELEALTPLQQALALAHASVVRARNASHLLTKEEMAPYVDLVLRNERSPFGSSSVLQLRALLHRVSFERNRGRYLERCMAQMEEIANFVNDPFTNTEDLDVRALASAERIVLLLSSSLPPRWELMKELAISFGKIGLVKSAMDIFEKLEFWDELVDCHRLIGNLGRAEALVRERLAKLDDAVLGEGIEPVEDGPFDPMNPPIASKAVQMRAARRPRLLCVLGEITRDRKYFEMAWDESGSRYARAKRTLARSYVEVEDWEQAVRHFRDALAVNSLFPDTWFTYGCAAMKTGDMKLAANAFTTVVQQTPENGEAWNNLGRVLHELGKNREALTALLEAGKLKRDSWRIWTNVVNLGMQVGSGLDVVRGLERMLELRRADGVMPEALGFAVHEVIRMTESSNQEDQATAAPLCKRLLGVLARCSTLISTNPSVWAAYAELHELATTSESQQKAFDCRLKQIRALMAIGDWKREVNVLRHMAIACDNLAHDAIRSENEGSVRAASLQVCSVLDQTAEDFKGDEAFTRLTSVQQTLSRHVAAA